MNFICWAICVHSRPGQPLYRNRVQPCKECKLTRESTLGFPHLWIELPLLFSHKWTCWTTLHKANNYVHGRWILGCMCMYMIVGPCMYVHLSNTRVRSLSTTYVLYCQVPTPPILTGQRSFLHCLSILVWLRNKAWAKQRCRLIHSSW